MTRADYIVAYLTEFGRHVDLAVRVALPCADASYADDPTGDPEEAAQAEAAEWAAAS
jgi:hypothetical protein